MRGLLSTVKHKHPFLFFAIFCFSLPLSLSSFSFSSIFFFFSVQHPLRCSSGSKDTAHRSRCTAFIWPSSFTSRIQEYSKAGRVAWHKGRVRTPCEGATCPRIRYALYQRARACRLAAVRHTRCALPRHRIP